MDNKEKIVEKYRFEYYSAEEEKFAAGLKFKIEGLGLNEEAALIAYLMKADIKNENIKKYIIEKFGTKIHEKLELLHRISNINFPETRKQIENLRKLFVELTDDLNLIFIKLAERLITLNHYEEENHTDLMKISEECLYLYSPIAHRLGIRKIYTDMDDISFKILFPEDFRKLNRIIEKRRKKLEDKLDNMSRKITEILRKNGIEAKIQKRVKRLYSIFLKLKNKGVSVDDVFDLMALRVITDSVEKCYLTLGLVHRNWISIEGRFRDWVTFPKPNGYRSIQTTIVTRNGDRFEVQIRTDEMHREAEYGSAAHWAYKECLTADSWVLRLKEFLENDEYFDNPYELLDQMKAEMKRDYIHILTPRGDIRTLPKDSTAVDFAYAIHTEVGNKTTGAKVNGKLVKLKTKLKSGDVVEVITNNNAKPSRDWLEFVKTSRARSKILVFVKKNEEAQLIQDGKRAFEKLKKRFRSKIEGLDDDTEFRRNLVKTGYKSPDDFYSALGIKSIKPGRPLLRKLYPEAFKSEKPEKPKTTVNTEQAAPKIEVAGIKNVTTTIAKCCNPIKGTDIIAYLTRNSQVKIHSKKCRIVKSGQLDEERLREAKWMANDSAQFASIRLFGIEFNKMFSEFVTIAEENHVSINSLERHDVDDRVVAIYSRIEVKDASQLAGLRSKLLLSREIDSVKIM